MHHETRLLEQIKNLNEVFWEQHANTIPIQEKLLTKFVRSEVCIDVVNRVPIRK